MSPAILRGQVHWVALDPAVGSEMAKTRPCVILSVNEINRMRKTVIIVPLTSTTEPERFPLVVAVPTAGPGSKVRIEHARSVDKSRLRGHVGHVSDDDLHEILIALARVLGLN